MKIQMKCLVFQFNQSVDFFIFIFNIRVFDPIIINIYHDISYSGKWIITREVKV
jgi:hypothetical protein